MKKGDWVRGLPRKWIGLAVVGIWAVGFFLNTSGYHIIAGGLYILAIVVFSVAVPLKTSEPANPVRNNNGANDGI